MMMPWMIILWIAALAVLVVMFAVGLRFLRRYPRSSHGRGHRAG
jgi:hypothetical protein